MSESPTLDELLAQAGWVRALARRLARGAEADDLEQETWLAVLRRPPRGLADARAWLARVLANRATSAARADERRTRRERAVAAAEALPATGELLGALDEQTRIAAAVRALEEPYRSTLLLHFYRGLSPSEIARRAGVPAGTVRSRLKRGLDLLRERFDREHGGDRRAWSLAFAAWAERELIALGGTALAVAGALLLAVAGGGSWLAWRAYRGGDIETVHPSEHLPSTAATAEEQAPTQPSDSARTASREESAATPPAVLVTGTRYHGHVFAPDRIPVAGAALTLHRERDGSGPPLATGTTDARGVFEFVLAEFLPAPLLVIAAPGFVTREQQIDPEREIALELRWSVTLLGCVRSRSDGRPLAGARVHSWEHGVVTRADGRFTLDDLPSGSRSALFVAAEGFAPVQLEPFLRGPEPAEIEVTLAPAEELECVVIDDESGRPLAGATLRAFVRRGPILATTDIHGRARVPFATGERLELEVGHAEAFGARWQWTPTPAEEAPHPSFPLRKKRALAGRALDAGGAPVEGAWVYATSDATFGSLVSAEVRASHGIPGEYLVLEDPESTRTDSDGRFQVTCFASELPWVIQTGARGWRSATSAPLFLQALTGDPSELDFRLERAAVVSGRVLRGGRPSGGYVEARASDSTRIARAFIQSGHYEFVDLPAGEQTFVVLDPDEQEVSEAPRVMLTLVAGEQYEQDFEWGALWVPLTGRVRAAEGPLPPDVEVGLKAGSSDEYVDGGYVDADGNFELASPPGTEVLVTAGLGDHTQLARWSGPAGSTGVELVLVPLEPLRILVLEESSRAPVRADRFSAQDAVFWTRSDGSRWRVDANLDPRGLLELALYPGVYDVELDLTSGGYLPGRLRGLVVGEGESREHELLLTRGLDRFVRLDPPPSAADGFGEHLVFLVHESQLEAIAGPYPEQGPPSNRRINGICMRLDDPTLMEQLLSRDDFASTGKTRLFGLKPGRYVIKSYPDDYLFEPPTLELSPTSPDELVLRWHRR